MNTIKVFSDINTRTTDIFRRADDTQPLYIALDSVGGSVYEAFKIYDLIRERQQPTFVNVVGYCYSAASVILLAASSERRTASANASFLIHSPYRDWETDRKSTRLNSSHSAKSRMPSSA